MPAAPAIVLERFALEEEIRRGPGGTVFRGRDLSTGGAVAVKLGAARGAAGERFEREARLLARVRHPAVVEHVAHGALDDALVLVMEWVDGEPLSSRLSRGRLTPPEAITLARRLAEGVAAAHRIGVIHRDLKPGNVLLRGGDPGRPVVIDFGLARPERSERGVTEAGVTLGTPGYMAPEQARGQLELDASVDVFSLGCILYHCLSGCAPFTGGDDVAVLLKSVLEDAPVLSQHVAGIEPALDALVRRAMAKAPGLRPPHAGVLVADLEALPTSASRERTAEEAFTGAEQSVQAVIFVDARPLGALEREHLRLSAERVDELAEALGGRAVQLVDGSLAVVLAGGEAMTDLAHTSARAALALLELLSATVSPGSPEPESRVRVSVAVGRGDSTSGAPIGDAIDRALRGIDEAPDAPRAVVLDDVVAELLDARFVVRHAGRTSLLIGERDAAPSARTLLGRVTPFVGREPELASLLSWVEQRIAGRSAGALLVTAGPGMGKSRLRYEMLRRLWEGGHKAQLLHAGGDPLHDKTPFGLIAPALRRSFGVREDDPDVVRRHRIKSRVDALFPAPDAERVYTWLLELCGVTSQRAGGARYDAARQSPRDWTSQLVCAFEDLLMAETARRPVILILEDLHWGDTPSLLMVERALQMLRERPLCVLALARPEALARHPSLSGPPWERLELAPLAPEAATALAREVLGPKASEGVVQAVVEQAAGNAFFLEELLRAASEERTVVSSKTAIAISQMRIAALPVQQRRLVRAASIFGKRSWVAGLRAIMGPSSPLESDLAALIEAEILTRTGTGRLASHGEELAFRHDLTREAAYDMLTEADRQSGHRKVAEWLEAVAPDDALAIAQHHEEAGDTARAAGAYHRAAAEAFRGDELDLAVDRASRAIACGASGADLVALHLLLLRANRWRDANHEILAAAREVLALADFGSAAWCEAAVDEAAISRLLGDATVGVRLGKTLEGLLHSRARSAPIALAAARLTQTLFLAGDNQEALSLRSAMLPAIAELSGEHPELVAQSQLTETWFSYYFGCPDDCVHIHGPAAAAAILASGEIGRAAIAYINQASGLKELGEYEAAEAAAREGFAMATRHRMEVVRGAALNNLGLIRARRGAASEGIDVLTEAAALGRRLGDAATWTASLTYRAEIHNTWGRHAEGARDAREALDVAEKRNATFAMLARATLSQALVRLDRAAEALALAEEAFSYLQSTGHVEEGESRVYLALAESLEEMGDHRRALSVIERAVESLQKRAARFRRDSVRTRFLEDVPDNVHVMTVAQRLRGG